MCANGLETALKAISDAHSSFVKRACKEALFGQKESLAH